MWYLAAITLAAKTPSNDGSYHCEECNVLFESDSARGAYLKAIAWAAENSGDTTALLGVSHLTTVGDKIGEGVDICGRVFSATDVWERQAEYSPPVEELGAMFTESSMDVPIVEALGEAKAKQLLDHLGTIAPELKPNGDA